MGGMLWKVLGLGVLVVFLVGCEENKGTVQTGIGDPGLTSQADLNGANTQLKVDLARAEQDRDLAQANAEQWKARYQVAVDNGGGRVSPTVLVKFMEIAKSGKYWEYRDGVLRANSDILFDSGKAELKPQSAAVIQEVAGKLKEILTDKSVVLRVDGHTDSDPIRVSHWADLPQLSAERARAVANALVKAGVPNDSIFIAGFGASRPIAGADKAQNRRVELVLLPATGVSAQ